MSIAASYFHSRNMNRNVKWESDNIKIFEKTGTVVPVNIKDRRKDMKRKTVVLTIVIVLMLALCSTGAALLWAGSKKEEAAPPKKEAAVEEEMAVEGEKEEPSDFITMAEIRRQIDEANIDWMQQKGKAINVALQSESDTWALEELGMLDLFEELTGIKLNYTMFEEAQLREKTTIDYITKTGIYDLAMSDPAYMSSYAKAGVVEDLRPYLNNPQLTDKEWFDPDDFPQGFKDMGTFYGILAGWPMHLSGQMLYWNKKYFEKYGLDPERGPRNMDELRDFAKKCHHPEDGVYGIALRGLRGDGLNVFAWSSFMRAFGGRWFDENWNPQLDSPEVIKSIQFYSDLLKDYGPPGVANWEWSKIMTAMAEGTIAITVDAPTFSYVIEDPEKSKTVGEWGYGPNPAGPKKQVMTPFSWYLTINKSSKRKEATWLFIQFIMSKPVQVAIGGPIIATGRLSAIADPAFEKGNPWLPAWREAITENAQYADALARPGFPQWPEVGDIMGAELESVIAGLKDPADAAKAANTRIRQVMEEAGYYD